MGFKIGKITSSKTIEKHRPHARPVQAPAERRPSSSEERLGRSGGRLAVVAPAHSRPAGKKARRPVLRAVRTDKNRYLQKHFLIWIAIINRDLTIFRKPPKIVNCDLNICINPLIWIAINNRDPSFLKNPSRVKNILFNPAVLLVPEEREREREESKVLRGRGGRWMAMAGGGGLNRSSSRGQLPPQELLDDLCR
jgi:hypothetical protein